jgi:signal peptidase I
MSFEQASAPAPADTKRKKHDRAAFVAASVVGILLLLGIIACAPGVGLVIKVYTIASDSMAPGLRVGRYAIVSRLAYGYSRYTLDWMRLPIQSRFPMITPQRGDVVVFKLPRDDQTDYIKRIVGLPGDTVQLIKGRLYIDGKMIAREEIPQFMQIPFPTYRESFGPGESHIVVEADYDHGFYDDTPPYKVPQGEYFVLGDNRDNSTDSRVAADAGGVGFVPLENLTGRVIGSF